MISWKSELKAAEMAQVASFVLSLQGTTPAEPKEAEGDLWVNPDAPAPVKDVVTDSIAVQLTSN